MTTTDRPDAVPVPEAPLPREAYTLLAQANLLRMRGRWDEAVEKCMAAMRLAPESASAQSLLGDIYENQGRFDDAIQWYRMALDVNPDSPADKLKLGRLLSSDARRSGSRVKPDSAELNLPVQGAAGARPPADAERVLRGVAWLAAALFVVAAILSGMVMAKHRPASGPITAPPIVVSAPTTVDPGTASSNDPGTAAAAPGDAATGNGDASGTAPVSPSVASATDPAEEGLLQALQQDSALTTQNLAVVGVQIDPRQNIASVTVLCPPPSTGVSLRDALLRDAAQIALDADRAQGDRIPTWTIRCLLPVAGNVSATPPNLALVADMTSASISALGQNVTSLPGSQLEGSFRNVWWSPSVSQ